MRPNGARESDKKTTSLLRRNQLKRPSGPGFVHSRLLHFSKCAEESAFEHVSCAENEVGEVILSKGVPRSDQTARILHENDLACWVLSQRPLCRPQYPTLAFRSRRSRIPMASITRPSATSSNRRATRRPLPFGDDESHTGPIR
jgi:hypothetical protein